MDINNKGVDALLNMASKKFGTTPDKLRNNLQSGDLSQVMKGMDSSDSEKLQQALSSPDMMKKVMNSPEAQALIKKLSGQK